MRDAEGRKKEASKVIQTTKQSNSNTGTSTAFNYIQQLHVHCTCTCTSALLQAYPLHSHTRQIQQPGQYFPEKVSVKCGSLDFVVSEPSPQGWWLQPLIATAKTEELSISLLPNLGS